MVVVVRIELTLCDSKSNVLKPLHYTTIENGEFNVYHHDKIL